MSVWANHTNIFVFGCFWGVLDNFRGDIKFRKKIQTWVHCGACSRVGLGNIKIRFHPPLRIPNI